MRSGKKRKACRALLELCLYEVSFLTRFTRQRLI